MTRVLLVCGDAVGRRMAGPAIRAVELGRVLAAAGHEVTVATPDVAGDADLGVVVRTLSDQVAADLAAGADVVVGQGWPLERWPVLRRAATLVVDLYDPYHLEGLVADSALPLAARRERHRGRMAALTAQLREGDLFLCAGDRQRDMWLGALSALGRVNADTYADDPTLRRLVDSVPFGVPAAPPAPRRRAIRDGFPAVLEGDCVLLWGGGLYDWFDPLTLVSAVALALPRAPGLRLVVNAAPHPSAAAEPMAMAVRTRALADELGLTGSHVLFNETWVPYEERADWLCDADVGVSTHLPHVETEFAYRTRMLDYLWAGLPILCTAGDVLADEVEHHWLGVTVPPEDTAELADAIVRLATEPALRREAGARARSRASERTWERVAAPLLRFCSAPSRAADRPATAVTEEATASAEPGGREAATAAARAVAEGIRAGWRSGVRRINDARRR
ncbi:MAG TPA: glycosyltransferase family 4 protein [Candidatus Dormibacteraeota bacterium]|nr:glycosyltransferase family 4 protein [Candidatus Dormibacteraeota bacterium]